MTGPRRAPLRALFFGDSFVNGVGDDECLGWVGRVCAGIRAQGLDLTVYNLGVRGNTSRDIRIRWKPEAEARLVDATDVRLLFSFGANDCVWRDGGVRVPVEETVLNARAILSDAARLGRLLFVGSPPIADDATTGRIKASNQRLQAVCAEMGVPFLDVCAPLLRSSAYMEQVVNGDGAHPGAGGYRLFAELVRNWPAWRSAFSES